MLQGPRFCAATIWASSPHCGVFRDCRRAVDRKPNGRVVLLEFVVPAGNQPHPAKIIDIEMLFFPGGREGMQEQWRHYLLAPGSAFSRILPTKSPFSVIEAEVA